jgi:hypothetical protein
MCKEHQSTAKSSSSSQSNQEKDSRVEEVDSLQDRDLLDPDTLLTNKGVFLSDLDARSSTLDTIIRCEDVALRLLDRFVRIFVRCGAEEPTDSSPSYSTVENVKVLVSENLLASSALEFTATCAYILGEDYKLRLQKVT